MIRTVADDPYRVELLLGAIGEDLALLQTLFEQYSERTQPGRLVLGRLIDEHGGALLYDMRTLGVDLRELIADGLALCVICDGSCSWLWEAEAGRSGRYAPEREAAERVRRSGTCVAGCSGLSAVTCTVAMS